MIKCPKHNTLVNTCLGCQYICTDQDVSNVWCRYRIGRKEKSNPELRDLMIARNHKEEAMNRAYKVGYTMLGDRISREIGEIDQKIRKKRGETG